MDRLPRQGAAKQVSKCLRQGDAVDLGKQHWSVAGIPAFVLPSSSGANRDPNRLEGKQSRVEWWRELRKVLPVE